MLEDLQAIDKEVATLINWIAEMKGLISNPYAAGLNIPRVLEDLSGFAAGLNKRIYDLEQKMEKEFKLETEESEKAEFVSVEQ